MHKKGQKLHSVFSRRKPCFINFSPEWGNKKGPLRKPLRDELFSTDIRLIGFLEFHNYFLSYLDA
ncbi:hypothetical protein EYX55_01205 [Escherichia coli]|nr:hypothetical protein [Salmonella enterica]EFA4869925.1 hypothetical protein [Escherichia coli]EHW51033.1 hypothetical protein ECDEC9D_3033 [Escherichia coli DEC9D]EFA5322532.1 hypothetical protein [Escherichia coli]EFI4375220.1 hypothetical protein [Escherichia coli]